MMWSATGRRVRAVIAWVGLLVALGACGPGTVGTGSGTGDSGSEDIQYTPVGLCTAPFAETALACPTDIRDPDRGTPRVQWADANKDNEGAAVLAVLEGNGMTLQIACLQVNFTGRWGELPDGTLAFVGRYVSPDAPGEGQPAVVRVEDAKNEPDAVGWLQVDDGGNGTLFGPWIVRRVEGQVTFAACGP